MSLKPLKKSDMGKDWAIGTRRDKQRSINPEYHLIVTEGTKTEPQYFNEIKRRINERFRERISLEIVGDGSNTVSLFESAKSLVKESNVQFKHIWVVYDTDDFPKDKIDVVPSLCEANSTDDCIYHAIWSNQCIELWYLLHFGFYQSDIHRSQYYPKLTRWLKKNNADEYKKNREDMFVVLEPFIDDAIRNATKLQEENDGKSSSQSAPGTKVYELIEILKPYF